MVVSSTVNDLDRGIQRRIKRHIWAAPHRFVAACGYGLEDLLAAELAEMGLEAALIQTGAVEFEGRFTDLYRVNLESALAERIWWRVLDRRDRGLPHLADRLAELEWELLLGPGFRLEPMITGSGLDREARDRLASMIVRSYRSKMGPVSVGPVQRLLLRRSRRRWHLGLDASGDRLHRRGYRLATARAPLRETLAAAVLRLAGYDPQTPLFDPMCGSGTFLIEAARRARGMAPGEDRSFACLSWANFREPTWSYLVRQARQRRRPDCPAAIVGLDRHPTALRAVAANAARAGVESDLDLRQGNFFGLKAPGGPPGLVVLNPPYGRRLPLDSRATRYYRRLGDRLAGCFPGWAAAVLAPNRVLAASLGLADAHIRSIKSGGRNVFVVCGRWPCNGPDTDPAAGTNL
jgi:putative N6-adenine-specific DNA methylase